MKSIGEFLKDLREIKKLSFREAAEKSGLSHSYIRYLESGKRPGTNTPINPTPDALKKLADAYDHSYEDLLVRAGYIDSQLVIDMENPDADPRYMTIEETKYARDKLREIEDEKISNDIGYILRRGNRVYFEGTEVSTEDIDKIYEMIKVIIK